MKKMKRLFSAVLIIVMMLTIMIPAAVPSVSAASNASTAFNGGRFVKIGNYYFSKIYAAHKSNYYLLRTNLKGTQTKVIAKGIDLSDVYGYKDVAYFSVNGKVYTHDTKTLKTGILRKTDQTVRGICASGLITRAAENDDTLYLLNYKGKFRRVGAKSSSFIAANEKYIFYTKVESKTGTSTFQETDRIYRYTIKTGDTKKMGAFKIMSSPNDGQYARTYDSHVFKNDIAFIYGHQEGTGMVFHGAAFAVKADGSGLRVLQNKVGMEFTPGKNCVYFENLNLARKQTYIYQFDSSGKYSTLVKYPDYCGSTVSGYRLNSVLKKNTQNRDLYVSDAASKTNGKYVLNSSRFLKSTDPSGSYSLCSAEGAVGNVALVTVNIYSPLGAAGGRVKNARTYVYLYNVKYNKYFRLA